MPAVVEPGSAFRSRVRFQDPTADSEAADVGGNDANGELAVVSGGFPVQRFELQEDLSFWKDHNVQVVIRIRPLSSSEISLQGHNRCVRQESCQTISWTGHPESRFTFDHVADEYVSQEKLFKVAGVPMVENCVAGYNSCMFAYGQTGSGKTHTMLGDIEGGTRRHSVNCGMTPRVFEHLFSRIQKEKESRRDEKLRFTCKCSFLEIYNEQILDLLNPSSVNLQIREDAKKGVHVENLTEFEVSSARDVMQQLIQGAANRKVAATNMNRASSRSHSVFTCVIESKWESQGVTHHRYARLNLVDLAGSERLVIMNLVSISNGKSLHVPYRDSKLTFLLQDSLGGNSKTIIIANISPSNCCALETLSTLKFAQRAKFIRNNAIINEDASGDVLSMRLQIQQLKKEVNRLRVLVNCEAENPETDGLSASVAGSPGSFKWEAGLGSFSPLTVDKRISQRKQYEAALIAAFRRDQDKEAALKAMAAGKQAAEQLATQRTEEVRSLKMRLRFREEGIKRLEAVASGKLSAETHLLQEKEELLKEIDILRNQVDRNPEVTRFAMENLQLREELRRLQLFVEEGEREMINEQISVLQEKLLEALDWKLMHEKDSDVAQDLSLSWESSTNEENEFLRLQAIQNQKEIEALRKNLSFCLEAKEKLERHVEELVSQLEEERKSARDPNRDIQDAQMKDFTVSGANDLSHEQVELKTMVDAIAAASQREAESHETAIMLAKENEQLRMKLKVLIEDNNRLIELYEGAVAEGSGNQAGNAPNMKNSENQVNCLADFNEDSHDNLSNENYDPEPKDVEHLEHQLLEMHEENEKLMGLYERAMHERDEFKRMLSAYEFNKSESKEETNCPEKLAEVDEERVYENQDKVKLEEHAMHAEVSEEKLHLVRGKLELVEDKLVTTGKAVQFFGLLENASTEVDELLENIGVMDHDVQLKQRGITALKHALSQIQERKTGVDNKFLALKFASNRFCSNVQYWEEREARARARVDACSSHLEQKNEELGLLKVHKDEISTACIKARHSESELRSNIDCLKLKLQDAETIRKETEKVLFAIDNLDKSDLSTQRGMNFGKASELLKSEEERTKLSAEMKQLREQQSAVQKEIAKWMKKSEALDMKIQNLEKEIKSGLLSLQESEHGLQQVVREKEMLLEMREDGRTELGILLVEYQECIFELDLKEGEIKLFEEAAQQEVSSLEDLRAKLVVATQKLNRLLEDNRRIIPSNSEECSQYVSIAQKVEREFDHVQLLVTEAKSLLLRSNS
ncbi:kinesin-like protein KIN-12G [Cocos nucifera]|uniref:Kinesin-like protein KIN-12G n=1 Tax=Cocos nucifera TaxID=13894 RepID=A0A8K0MXL4_COCNU|nr:kinesin-like protein KIN-12G [Cocos nucifera]